MTGAATRVALTGIGLPEPIRTDATDDTERMNNRQNNRRRGRNNNPRQGGGGRGADPQNRIDNRTRGNAVQLHEKYRNLARDAQTKGDRVEAEYWWQFADHYYRVVADQRARAEERQGGGRSQRDEWRAQAEEDDDRPNAPSSNRDDGDGDDWRRDARGPHDGQQPGQRDGQRGARDDCSGRSDEESDNHRVRSDEEGQAKRPRRSQARSDDGGDQSGQGGSDEPTGGVTRRSRRVRAADEAGDDQPVKRPRGRPRKVVEADVPLTDALPPSIASDGDAAKRPRGRPRKVASEEGSDTAVA